MEGFLIFLLIILIVGIFIVPIIILAKIGTINKNIDYLNTDMNNLNKRMTDLHNHTASRDDAKDILNAMDDLKVKTGFTPGVVSPLSDTKLENELVAKEEPVIEDIHKEIEEEVKAPVTEDIPVMAQTGNLINEESGQEMSPEPEQKESEETPPPFAAFNRSKRSEPIIEEILPRYRTAPVQQNDDEDDDDPDKNFIERLLGENWLSKVGIVTLVLGIGFFVKYAIDKEWINEVGRVGIGILTGGILIGIAHKLKSKYHVFSSILVGGGISVFYITITLAFREYELFSQSVAFGLLIAITMFSVILSLYYDRKELAIFSLLGGFASPLMVSTGTGNYIVLFSYILILNTGMLAVSFVKKWRIIGIISYVLTLSFFWAWTLSDFKDQFVWATVFTVLFFIQFYVLALFDHFKSKDKITAYQAFLILTNNLSAFLACLYIFDRYEYDVRGLVTIAIAAVNAIVMLTLFRKSKVDRNLIYLIIAVVMTFVSLAIPMQMHGHVITMFWAAEAVLLLWLWQMSHIKVFRLGFIVIAVLVLISYAMDINYNYRYDDALPFFVNRIFITGVVVIASFVINMLLLRREDADSDIEIGGFETISISAVAKAFDFIVIVLTFFVPFLELNYQLERFTDTDIVSSFRYLALATYTTVYVAVLGLVYRKQLVAKAHIFVLLFFSILLYSFVYTYLAIDLRFDIFVLNAYSTNHFLIHLISLPAIVYITYLLARNVKKISEDWFALLCWCLVVMSVAILSIEVDNIVILLLGNIDNYDSLLYDVHTFGYPILWGVIAMILMIWGLNRKEVLLRKISLIFFGVIIIKFYAYDVWHMSQAGRIVSFIMLGVILLLVSFLQQKIKTLVKDDSPAEDIIEEQSKKEE